MSHDLTYGDAKCLDAAGEMNEEEFRAFYERNARGVWAYLARVAGDRQIADDLLQETFYRFLRAESRYDNENHRRNALYRIATNLARDMGRRQSKRIPAGISGEEIEQVSGHDRTKAAEAETDVSRAMSQLKPRERAMLWLAYAEGASHQEIATVLGVTPGSMKQLLFRARRRLAGLLDGRNAA